MVVSLDGVLPHQVTTEWDRFYRVSCDVNMDIDRMVRTSVGGQQEAGFEGTVMVTTIFETKL